MTKRTDTGPEPVTDPEPAKPRRMTLSTMVELLLQRGHGGQSSVSLTRNARGVTQIEVDVKAGDGGEIATASDAYAKARELYDAACLAYPYPTEEGEAK